MRVSRIRDLSVLYILIVCFAAEFQRGQCGQCKCPKKLNVRCTTICSHIGSFPLRPLLQQDRSMSAIQRVPSGMHCTLDGKTHRNGESWTEKSAHSRGLGSNQCMECNCKAQVITCAIRTCPMTTCSNPINQPGTCCKTCPERSARPPRELSGCLSIGRRFQDKEVWQLYLPSPNVFATCVDCSCKSGRESCKKHPCPASQCSKPIKRPGHCCALCTGQNPLPRTSKESNSSIPTKENGLFGYLFVPGKEESKKNIENDKGMQSRLPGMPENTKLPKREEQNEKKELACFFGLNFRYSHNELFYPILNKKTQICTKCVCKNSIVNCARIRCPSRYPCKNPVKREGFCCKTCEDMNDVEARGLEAIQMYQSMGCTKAKRAHLQVYLYKDTQSSASQLSAKYLFDKSHRPNNKKSEIHELQFVSSNVNITRTSLDSDDMTRNALDKNWHYLGAIKEKIFKRILRLEGDLKRCRTPSRCIKKMTNLLEQVKTKALRRRRCESNIQTRSFGRLQKRKSYGFEGFEKMQPLTAEKMMTRSRKSGIPSRRIDF